MLAGYPGKGVKRIAIAAPGFSADCLETLEELGIRGRETFLAAGGEHFAWLDCLNDSPEGMTCCERLIGRELAGWLHADLSAAAEKREREHGTSGDRHRRNARHRRGDQRRAQGHGHEGRGELCRQ